MTPLRYLSTAIQRLTTDNRGSDHTEALQEEIHALRKALREAREEIIRLRQELKVKISLK